MIKSNNKKKDVISVYPTKKLHQKYTTDPRIIILIFQLLFICRYAEELSKTSYEKKSRSYEIYVCAVM